MSRTYRPRLSKDKAVAQRVGEELEKEFLGVDSLERQIAALKRIEQQSQTSSSSSSSSSSGSGSGSGSGNGAGGGGSSSSIVSRSRQNQKIHQSFGSGSGEEIVGAPNSIATAAATTRGAAGAVTAKPPAAKRKRAAPARTESSGSNDRHNDDNTKVDTARRHATNDSSSAIISMATNKGESAAENHGWACPSCSFLNRQGATQCRICRTKHYQPPSSAGRRTSGKALRGDTAATETKKIGHKSRSALRSDRAASSRASNQAAGIVLTDEDSNHTTIHDRTASHSKRRRSSSSAPAAFETTGKVESRKAENEVGKRRRQSSNILEKRAAQRFPVTAVASGQGATSVSPELTTPEERRQSRNKVPLRAPPRSSAAVSSPEPHISPLKDTTPSTCETGELEQSPEFRNSRRRRGSARRSLHDTGVLGPESRQPEQRSADFAAKGFPAAPSFSKEAGQRLDGSPVHATLEQSRGAMGTGAKHSDGHGKGNCGTTASATVSGCKSSASPEGEAVNMETEAEEVRQSNCSRNPAVRSIHESSSILVTPLTHEVTDARCAESVRPEVNTPTASRADTVPPAKSPLPSGGMLHAPWPSVSRVANLDFTGRSAKWEVSSIVVTRANYPRVAPAATAADCRHSDDAADGDATIVVCHSGGVSVWVLTNMAAVCTHLSPGLVGETTEKTRVRFHAASVVGVGGGPNGAQSTATILSSRTFIVAVGRQGLDPGPPVVRVWEAARLGFTSDFCLNAEGRGMQVCDVDAKRPPATLTAVLKKKFASFFPPMAPKSAAPCLCVCDYSAAGTGCQDTREEAGEELAEHTGRSAKITMVMALGGKAVRLVCSPGRRGSEEIRAKSLPTGSVGNTAIFASLATVPTNTSLVWATLPSSNAVLLWDTAELQLLFTLPLTAASICVPLTALPRSLTVCVEEESQGSDAPVTTVRRRTTDVKRESRLLCVLAAAGARYLTNGCCDISDESRAAETNGCELFGICCGWDEASETETSTGCVVSAFRLGQRDGERAVAVAYGDGAERVRKRANRGEDIEQWAPLECLCDGGSFVAGIDETGMIVARDVISGESCVLIAADPADNICFSAIGCDRNVDTLAVAVRDLDREASTAVALYVLGDGAGHREPAKQNREAVNK